MDQEEANYIDYVYRLAEYVKTEKRFKHYSGLRFLDAYHDYSYDEDYNLSEILVLVEGGRGPEDYTSGPHHLSNFMRDMGMEMKTVSINWEEETVTLIYHHELQ